MKVLEFIVNSPGFEMQPTEKLLEYLKRGMAPSQEGKKGSSNDDEFRIDCPEFMRIMKIDANSVFSDGTSILETAVQNGRSDLIEYLTNQKVNVDVQDANGMTALMHLIKNRKFVAAKKLSQTANIEIKDKNGKTAFDYLKDIRDFDPKLSFQEAIDEVSRPKMSHTSWGPAGGTWGNQMKQ
jgi:hypothetical protein